MRYFDLFWVRVRKTSSVGLIKVCPTPNVILYYEDRLENNFFQIKKSPRWVFRGSSKKVTLALFRYEQ